jgi:trans-aconitate 2-methyltransferase
MSEPAPPALKQWDATAYDDKHSFVWKRGADVVELLAPRAGERILDLGCGTGHLTNEIASRSADVVGIDPSANMIEQARRQYPKLRFEQADGRTYQSDRLFDAVFSNAVLHWIRPPERVIARVHALLKPGGRFAAEFGGRGNIAAIERAIHAAFAEFKISPQSGVYERYFLSVGEYAPLLEAAGFEVRLATLFHRPTPQDGGEQGLRLWLRTFANDQLAAVPEAQRERVLDFIERHTRDRLFHDGTWHIDYRRLRVVAVRLDA